MQCALMFFIKVFTTNRNYFIKNIDEHCIHYPDKYINFRQNATIESYLLCPESFEFLLADSNENEEAYSYFLTSITINFIILNLCNSNYKYNLILWHLNLKITIVILI